MLSIFQAYFILRRSSHLLNEGRRPFIQLRKSAEKMRSYPIVVSFGYSVVNIALLRAYPDTGLGALLAIVCSWFDK